MLPMVSNAGEARSIIQSMKYYPDGGRGVILRSAVDRYTAGPTMDKPQGFTIVCIDLIATAKVDNV